MDDQDVVNIEKLNLSKLVPYVHWVTGVVKACENLWLDAVAKKPVKDLDALKKGLDAIPFDAPIETKTALLLETERIGLELAPAFQDKKLRLTPQKPVLQMYIEMGALAKGTEKVLHKVHHYLDKELQQKTPNITIPLSNLTAMRGMMVRDYGTLHNLLWSMGKHDMHSRLDWFLDLIGESDPPVPVMVYELKTHKLIKGDFFTWAYAFETTIVQTTPKPKETLPEKPLLV